MKLTVIRQPSIDTYTPGELRVDGEHFCWTLEDRIREIDGKKPVEWKVFGETAMTAGTYPVYISWSSRFKRQMIEVRNVPGFTGIRVHNGPTEKSTDGCLLVHYERAADMRLKDYGRQAMLDLEAKVLKALTEKQQVFLEIINPKESDE